jgi:hypothetical protein
MTNFQYKNLNNGYAAISSVLVITVIIISLGLSASLLGINDMQSSLAQKKGGEALNSVEGCVEDILVRINEGLPIPTTLVLPGWSCYVTINSQNGSEWDIDVETSIDGYNKRINVIADRNSTISVLKWLLAE